MHEELLATARELIQPSADSIAEFNGNRTSVAAAVSERLSARTDIEQLVGAENLTLMDDNCRNFTDFMYSQLRSYSPETLVQTVIWALRVYQARGFTQTFWPAELRAFIHVVNELLSDQAAEEIRPFYEWILVNLPKAFEVV